MRYRRAIGKEWGGKWWREGPSDPKTPAVAERQQQKERTKQPRHRCDGSLGFRVERRWSPGLLGDTIPLPLVYWRDGKTPSTTKRQEA